MENNYEEQNPITLSNIRTNHDNVNTNEYFTKYLEIKELSTTHGKDTTLTEFSLYNLPILNTFPYSTINIEELYKRITFDKKLEKICEKIQGLSKEDQKIIKGKELEYITPSGTFNLRSTRELICHSGYLCIDFDNIPFTEIEFLKERLIKNKEIDTVMLFKSPTGTGLKWFIMIPAEAETHGMYFDAVKNYIQQVYNLEIDKNCRDIPRACFLSHDKNCYIAAPWELKRLDKAFLDKWLSITDNKKKDTLTHDPITNSDKINQVKNLVEVLKDTNTDITTHYNNWISIGWALCELGEVGRTFFHDISSLYHKYNLDETDEKYSSLLNDYDGSIKLGTLFHIAKDHNVIVPIPQELPVPVIHGNLPRTAQQRLLDAESQPDIKPLLGAIWQTGELHILFADTGVGKSVWAIQIADSLSKGENVFKVLSNGNQPLRVLFYDFELTDKQFQKRYMDEEGNLYEFSENLFVDNIDFNELMEVNPNGKIDDMVIGRIKSDIEKINPNVLIIDNLTYLKTQTTQDTAVALDLVRKLGLLKKQYNLSILVLAHTPKIKEGTPLTVNELGGSKHLSNFADSVSAIGKSYKAPNIRYIKQVKPSRSSEMKFDASNVIVVDMKKDDRFLGFNYLEFEHEADHLQTISKEQRDKEKQEKIEWIKDLYKQGHSYRDIEKITEISKSTVGKWLKQ